MRKDDTGLKTAIQNAATGTSRKNGRPILIFCSTADEGEYSGAVYPADYPEVIRVSATDKYGHRMTTAQADEVNVLVPGDDFESDAPSYIHESGEKRSIPRVSGSSVATALAAGIASLALVLLRIFNGAEEPAIELFQEKEKMLRVFKKMQSTNATTGVLLSKLFPPTLIELREKWNMTEFLTETEIREAPKKST